MNAQEIKSNVFLKFACHLKTANFCDQSRYIIQTMRNVGTS